MNTKQFLVLFFNLAVLLGVQGTVTTVLLGSALTVPLLSATAGTIATPLAVLGVLKLIAAKLYALGYIGLNGNNDDEGYESSGYGYSHGHRYRRAAANAETAEAAEAFKAPNADALFSLVAAMDTYGCGKQLICELEAKQQPLAADELLLVSLFSSRKEKKSVNPASAKAEYDLAADLGLASKNQLLCRKRYTTCPYTADDMMAALRNAQL